MNLAYPIQAILIYLSLLFAPPDAERIVFKGVDHSGVLHRDASGWNIIDPEGNIHVSIDGTRFVSGGKGGSLTLDLLAYLPSLVGHDWEKQPKLALPEATTLEKTPDGFKLHNNRGTEGIYEYTISYVRKNQAGGPTCNVLGAVKQPGIHPLPEGSTLRSVLLNAGGPAGKTMPHHVFLLGGKPGEKINQRESFDLAALLEGRRGNPPILDRDTLYVEPTVLLELARDGSLSVDGKACPAADLSAHLRDRVEAGVRSATLQSHRDTPHDRIQPILDACLSAGIPADRLKFDSAKVTD